MNPITITTEELAGLTNLTSRRLYQMADEHRIPQPTNGVFPLLSSISALFAFYQRDGETLQREKMLKVSAERKLREHELRIADKAYFDRREVTLAADEIGVRIRTVITQKLAREFPLRVSDAVPQDLKAAARGAAEEVAKSAVNDILEGIKKEVLGLEQRADSRAS